jgi:hypothetical protein
MEHEVYGHGAHTLVFMGEDTLATFRPYCKTFAEESGYRCMNVAFPGSRDRRSPEQRLRDRDVITFSDAAAALQGTVKLESFTFIAHGWACMIGFTHQQLYPSVICRMVCMEFGVRQQFALIPRTVFRLKQACSIALPCAHSSAWAYWASVQDDFCDGYYPPVGTPMMFLFGRGVPLVNRTHDDGWYRLVNRSYPGKSKCVPIPNAGRDFPLTHVVEVTHHLDVFLLSETAHLECPDVEIS